MPLTKVSSGVIAANAVVDSFGTQSITGDKLGLTAINANNIVNASITGNLLTANCVSGNNIVSGVALTGNVSVTGNVTVGAGTVANPAISVVGDTDTGIYFPSANTIGFTRGGIQVGEFDSTANANFKFNSGYGSVATAYGCRAWVNFNGTGTIAIRGSGNVSSITDDGTGQYIINFATAMPDANYAASISVKPKSDAKERPELDNLLAGSIRVVNDAGANDYYDTDFFTVAIFR